MYISKQKIIENALRNAREHYDVNAVHLQSAFYNSDYSWWEVSIIVHETLVSEWRLWNFDKQILCVHAVSRREIHADKCI